jgi:hypothetical protein
MHPSYEAIKGISAGLGLVLRDFALRMGDGAQVSGLTSQSSAPPRSPKLLCRTSN